MSTQNISAFDKNLLGDDIQKLSERLEKFIAVEHQFVDGSLVISLNAKYGAGKTAFLDMWKSSFDNEDELKSKIHEFSEKPLIVLLNAWESDYMGDPLFAVVSALVDSLGKNDNENKTKLIEAAKDLGWFMTSLGTQFMESALGASPKIAANDAMNKNDERNNENILNHDSFSLYQHRKVAMAHLKDVITSLVNDTSKPSIIFMVDELDRCRPDYAIAYLETIKHIFDIKGIVFLLAVDRSQLENSARTTFGKDLEFSEYYRKFVHREINLPVITSLSCKKLVDEYVNKYIKGNGTRYSVMGFDDTTKNRIAGLIEVFNLTPRQVQEIFRILGHIGETTSNDNRHLEWCVVTGTILLLVLRVRNQRFYQTLGTGQLEPNDVYELFEGLSMNNSDYWWFKLCLTGKGLKIINKDRPYKAIIKLLNLPLDEMAFESSLIKFVQGWGSGPNSNFHGIYKHIENLDQWTSGSIYNQ
ncbi:KAP family P-loop NTPase fold protein [Nitrosomonas marina]|uniref:KAP family P-loop domain-containing protein n=1 Tax=Nitrosomonas marina TaxID=917 RepID=A0A1H8FYA6_9PROT|nr:P-loop NTPase fold protein [Nitrosomonas marina]SEN36078.1 KAP family P-loop domain-containing protein [Nitrosomonas marina]